MHQNKVTSSSPKTTRVESSSQRLFCGYCQRFKTGKFRFTGNYGTTRICEDCYALRRRARKLAARQQPAASDGHAKPEKAAP